jgi:hypothetical protein
MEVVANGKVAPKPHSGLFEGWMAPTEGAVFGGFLPLEIAADVSVQFLPLN